MTNKSQGLSFVLLWAFGNAEIFTSYMETFGQWTNQFVENLLHINRLEILKSNVCSAFSGQFRIKPWSPSPSTQLGFYNICKSSNYAKCNIRYEVKITHIVCTKAVTTYIPQLSFKGVLFQAVLL